jgi:hypothetical protein
MRPLSCPVCAHLVFFENSLCLNCQTEIGFARDRREFLAVDPTGGQPRRCGNHTIAACNWLAADGKSLCDCCALTRTRPADGDSRGLQAFARLEAAKRRLLYQLDDLGLPVVPRSDDPRHGLAFDLLSSSGQPVTTGHASGVITIDLAEGDDGYRETVRVRLAEPYRTLLGHVRHEVGHWYWDVLVTGTSGRPALERFRQLFGDERRDYADALRKHYAGPPPDGWAETYVSGYAAAHPWEDWAETFAHYLHIHDCLQTAATFGIAVEGPRFALRVPPAAPVVSEPQERPTDFDEIVATWLPLALALNQVNRSMGKQDLYPFVLSHTVLEKLGFVHRLVPGTDPHRSDLQGTP